jgi:ferredoxin--NADP+ reductase
MSLSVAIVGAGPAGFYTADALLKQDEGHRIDIVERLPTPYGLIRFGVAPDHQTTKRVVRQFQRIALNENVSYFGNVAVGRDVDLDELRGLYDAVVLTVGAGNDRPLGVAGEDKRGVVGSAAFVGWYNAHPDFRDLEPGLNSETVVVIGNGNVAIDVARVLVKTPAEAAASDLTEYAARAIHGSPLTDVYVVGRRGPVDAKFTNVELREMGELEDTAVVVDARQLPDDVGDLPEGRERRIKEKNLASLKSFAAMAGGGKTRRVHFVFYASPVEILGPGRVEAVRFERTRVEDGHAIGTGEFFEIPCGLVVASVGYRSDPLPGAPFDDRSATVPNDDGRVAPGLYAAGWIKRGPSGVIGTNRPDAAAVAAHIAEDFPNESAKSGRDGLAALLKTRGVRVVSFDDWLALDEAEVAAASAPAPRRKFDSVEGMLAHLDRIGRRGG